MSGPLPDPDGPQIEELARTPTLLHLAAIASSLVLYLVAGAQGLAGNVLIGHSTGELTALAAADALAVSDAARVLCEREVALADGGFAGGLTAVRTGAQRAGHLCGATGGWTLMSSLFNAPEQTVISGAVDELARLEKVTRAAGVQATRLLVVHPHHNPILALAAHRLAHVTVDYRLVEPATKVYSPLLGGFARKAGDVRRIIDRHLVDPVPYQQAIRALCADHGVGTFIEVGVHPILTECVRESLPPSVPLVGPLPGATDAKKILAVFPGSAAADGVQDTIPSAAVADPVPMQPSVPAMRLSDDRPTGLALAAAPAELPTPLAAAAASGTRSPEREKLLSQLRRTFAEALGYPEGVSTEDTHLEADLGIASVKKTELLAQLIDESDLSPCPPASVLVRDYTTLPRLADLMEHLAADEDAEAERHECLAAGFRRADSPGDRWQTGHRAGRVARLRPPQRSRHRQLLPLRAGGRADPRRSGDLWRFT
ncbi:Erythronolide synthase, modules 1 and 2 (plasmid) [Streptomyces sp. YIM 121038]|uniref:acyltransferase domain-containing protein n=1 Tax=Streptomyces sp. YIM 121038 TaxID=2136401 RepID=UPI001162D97E|nr:acyltransferase domain-containing protein [Streptomyces sp. YIM 121038]QCX82467.1 Erythronolide synthase, modules 1 and 2 [Streptomyces sp. YIM 121038]